MEVEQVFHIPEVVDCTERAESCKPGSPVKLEAEMVHQVVERHLQRDWDYTADKGKATVLTVESSVKNNVLVGHLVDT